MKPRRIILGCAVIAILFLAVAVIGGLVAVRRLTSPAPLAEASSFIDEGTRGIAVLRIDPGEPWLDNFSRLAPGVRVSRQDIDEALPLKAIWSLQAVDGGMGQMVGLSLSPRGRLFGKVLDLTLWRLGRSARKNVARVEYGDEGISSFPGTPVTGHVFVRDNQLVWASSLDTARRGVDLLRRPAAAMPAGATEVLRLPDFDGFLSGAASGDDPLLRWGLSLLAGEEIDSMQPGQPALLSGVTFTLETTSTDEATGEMTLHFRPGTDLETARRAAARAAANISSAAVWDLTLDAAPRPGHGGPGAILDLHVSGLAKVAGRLIAAASRLAADLDKADLGDAPVIRID